MRQYVAYAGSYSYTGKCKGLTIFDVDVENGRLIKRTEVEVDNSSDIISSHNNKFIYSVEDYGVVAFRVLENGMLDRLGERKIDGMRPHQLSTDSNGKFLFVSGYHDGKLTILKLNQDGSVGQIVDEVYHKGLGSIAERASRPHITCSKPTPDMKFVLSADPGIDQVSIYRFNGKQGQLHLVDAIRPGRRTSPTDFTFSADKKFLYLMFDMTNRVDVYRFTAEDERGIPQFEKIQTVMSTGSHEPDALNAATCMVFTADEKHVFVGNAGSNTVTLFNRDEETGLLDPQFNLPVSGEYPKDIAVFPDGNHIAVVNHESDAITLFRVDYEKKVLIMCTNAVPILQPNTCIIIPAGSD